MELVQERKVCDECGINALFTNREISLINYGEVTYSEELHCENCGA